MISNTTKDKGDLGLISVIRDLQRVGIKSCLPISEHLPFDLVAVNDLGNLFRISVKYKSLKNGQIRIPLKSVYSNTKGSFAKTIDFTLIDCIAVYCPETDGCYYVGRAEIEKSVNVFVLRPKNFVKVQNKSHIAEDYQDINKIWKVDRVQ